MRIEFMIKQIRKEKGYSLEQLSKLTGISKSHLNYIERNEKEPTFRMVLIIAQVLDVDMNDLYKMGNF